MSFEHHSRLWLPVPREELFPFFADVANLEIITPPWLRFRTLTPLPVTMCAGALIDYRLRWRGMPVRWRTKIDSWEPPRRFVDRQLRGPYRMWVHEHLFEPGNGGTEVLDRVTYAVLGGALVQRLIVGRDVESIFEYRRRRLLEIFGGPLPVVVR